MGVRIEGEYLVFYREKEPGTELQLSKEDEGVNQEFLRQVAAAGGGEEEGGLFGSEQEAGRERSLFDDATTQEVKESDRHDKAQLDVFRGALGFGSSVSPWRPEPSSKRFPNHGPTPQRMPAK